MTRPFRAARHLRCGISLVELLVVIAIMMVVAGMIVATASKVLTVVHQWK
jgi:Tfp pilus assembly protein FimT